MNYWWPRNTLLKSVPGWILSFTTAVSLLLYLIIVCILTGRVDNFSSCTRNFVLYYVLVIAWINMAVVIYLFLVLLIAIIIKFGGIGCLTYCGSCYKSIFFSKDSEEVLRASEAIWQSVDPGIQV